MIRITNLKRTRIKAAGDFHVKIISINLSHETVNSFSYTCVLYDVFDCFPTNFSSHTRLRSANRKARPSSQRISESETPSSLRSPSVCSGAAEPVADKVEELDSNRSESNHPGVKTSSTEICGGGTAIAKEVEKVEKIKEAPKRESVTSENIEKPISSPLPNSKPPIQMKTGDNKNNKSEEVIPITDNTKDTKVELITDSSMLAKSDSGFSEKATTDQEEDLDDDDNFDHEPKPELSLDKAYQLFDKRLSQKYANFDDDSDELDEEDEIASSKNGDFCSGSPNFLSNFFLSDFPTKLMNENRDMAHTQIKLL